MSSRCVVMVAAGITIGNAGVTHAQEYPTRLVRIVVNEAGSGSDIVARMIAPGLSEGLAQPIIVENRGGSVVIVAELVSKAPPDGYTLMINAGTLWQTPLLQTTPYDVIRDFAPIAVVTRVPSVLVVHPSLPAKSVKELIALARARPGELNYSTSASASPSHLAGEQLKGMTGINIVNVPYKSGGSAINALMSGEVQLYFGAAGTVSAHIRSGRMRALAVASPQPSPLFPGMPTVASAGLPGFESVVMAGMFAPAKTPAATINRVNRELVQTLNRTDIKERFFNGSIETVGSSPQEFAIALKADIARWGKVITDAGIRGMN